MARGRLSSIMASRHGELLAAWLERQRAVAPDGAAPAHRSARVEQSAEVLRKLGAAMDDAACVDASDESWSRLREALDHFATSRAGEGFRPPEVAGFLLSLKRPLLAQCRAEPGGDSPDLLDDVMSATALFDELALRAVEGAARRPVELVAASPAAVYALRAAGEEWEPTYASEGILRLTGFSPEQAMQPRWWQENVHPDDLEGHLARQRELRTVDTVTGEYRFRHRDGRWVWIRDEQRRLAMDGDRVVELVGIWTDVGESKRAEQELLETKESLQRAEEAAGLGSWRLEVGAPSASWSPQMFRLFGLDPDGGVPSFEEYLERVHPEDRALVKGVLDAIREGRDPRCGPFRTNPAHGPVRHLRPTWRRVDDETGAPRLYEGTVLDVTEQTLVAEALRDGEARYRTLFEANPHPMCVYDLETLAFLAVNDAAIRHYGYSREEFLAMTIKDIRPPEDVPRLLENVARVTEGLDVAGTWRHLKKDGTLIDVEIVSHTLEFDGRRAELVLMHDVTDRLRADAALRESEARLRVAVRAAAVGLFDWDLRTNRVRYSPEWKRQLGYQEHEISDSFDEWRDRLHPDDVEPMLRILHRYLERPWPDYRVEFRMRHRDGTYRWIMTQASLLPGADGKPERMLGSHVDITATRRVREALEKAQAVARLGSWELDVGTRVGFWSAEMYRVTGFDAGAGPPTFDAFVEWIHPEDREGLVRLHERGVRTGEPFTAQFRSDPARGPVKHLFANVEAVRDSGGRVVQLVGTLQDVTDEWEKQEQLRKLTTALEQASVSILITDAEGRIEYVNPHFMRATGWALDEIRGANPRVLESDRVPAKTYDDLRRTVAAGREWRGELQNRRKDGSHFWERVAVAPVRDARGVITHFVAVAEDITVQRSLEEQLRQAQKMEAVGLLAGGVAHDFNNMLGAVTGYAELAQGRLADTDPAQADLAEILRAARRSSGLVRQLLAFARRQTIEPRIVDLNEVVGESEKMLRRLLTEDIRVRFRPGRDLGNVRMDPGQVDQILANFAVNAQDAITGGGEILIETRNVSLDDPYCAEHTGFRPGDYVLLAFSDSGAGMDREIRDRIFEPFFTTKGPGKGTGLGLATVYGIVKQNHAFINVYSEPGVGTTFKIYFPRVEGAAETVRPPRTEPPKPGTETIVVVEDDPQLLALFEEMLTLHGYDVVTVALPAEALATCHAYEGDVHLLLTDVVMPAMNGAELADRVRALKPRIKVLFMSGYTADFVAERGVVSEGVHFLQKPFTAAELARKVRDVLDG